MLHVQTWSPASTAPGSSPQTGLILIRWTIMPCRLGLVTWLHNQIVTSKFIPERWHIHFFFLSFRKFSFERKKSVVVCTYPIIKPLPSCHRGSARRRRRRRWPPLTFRTSGWSVQRQRNSRCPSNQIQYYHLVGPCGKSYAKSDQLCLCRMWRWSITWRRVTGRRHMLTWWRLSRWPNPLVTMCNIWV